MTTQEILQMRARAHLRQAKCPECERKGYDEVGGECGWCEERAEIIHALLMGASEAGKSAVSIKS